MQTTMTIQENGVFIPVAKAVLEQIKAHQATQVNYDFNEWGFSVTPVTITTKKSTLEEDNFESHDIAEVLKQLTKRDDLTISPEVARLMGSLKPHMATEKISEEEQAFFQPINEDDERIKAYGI